MVLAGRKPQPQQLFISWLSATVQIGHVPSEGELLLKKRMHPALRRAGSLSVPTAYRTPQVKMFSAESKRIFSHTT